VKSGLAIIPAESVLDVLKVALVREPEPIEWDEDAETAAAAAAAADTAAGAGASLAH
jgi:ATP-dependent Lon protease